MFYVTACHSDKVKELLQDLSSQFWNITVNSFVKMVSVTWSKVDIPKLIWHISTFSVKKNCVPQKSILSEQSVSSNVPKTITISPIFPEFQGLVQATSGNTNLKIILDHFTWASVRSTTHVVQGKVIQLLSFYNLDKLFFIPRVVWDHGSTVEHSLIYIVGFF